MKSLRYLVCGAALLASVGASSASAVMWNPSGTNVSASQEGTGTLITNTGASIACATGSTVLQAPVNGDTAMNVNANPITFTGCVAQNLFVTHVTTFGTWHFKATSLTNVDITATGATDGTNRVATINITNLGCHVSVDGPVNIPNNTWNNATTTLSISNATSFELTVGPSEACVTTLGTTGHFEHTNYSAPTAMLT